MTSRSGSNVTRRIDSTVVVLYFTVVGYSPELEPAEGTPFSKIWKTLNKVAGALLTACDEAGILNEPLVGEGDESGELFRVIEMLQDNEGLLPDGDRDQQCSFWFSSDGTFVLDRFPAIKSKALEVVPLLAKEAGLELVYAGAREYRREMVSSWLVLDGRPASEYPLAEESVIAQTVAADVKAACAKVLTMTPSEIRLMAGEMTAQEMRTVQAVLGGLASKIRGLEVYGSCTGSSIGRSL